MENLYKIVFGKPHNKKQLGKYRCRWKDDIKTDIKENMRMSGSEECSVVGYC